MKGRMLLIMTSFSILTSQALNEAILPHEVEELAQALHNQKDVACVSVDGFFAGIQQWPSCTFCNRIKEEKLQHNPTVMKWYSAFSACRCSEHHELIRSLAWGFGPTVGGTAGYTLGNYFLADSPTLKKWLSIPLTCIAALYACKLNKKIYAWVSDLLDRRADGAAAAVCTDIIEKSCVLDYLESQAKSSSAQDAARASSQPSGDNEYQLFCVNAYDGAQSNLCSFITINIKLPVPWLLSENELRDKQQQRIAYIKNALRKEEVSTR